MSDSSPEINLLPLHRPPPFGVSGNTALLPTPPQEPQTPQTPIQQIIFNPRQRGGRSTTVFGEKPTWAGT